MSKSVIVSSCFIYLLSFMTEKVILQLVNLPLLTIYHLQVYRLVTAPLVHMNFLMLLFSLLSIVPLLSVVEQQKGSVGVLVDFWSKNLVIQSVYCVVAWLVSYLYMQVLLMPSGGCWPLVMVYLTTRCLLAPEEQTNLLCFPILIRNKYYPLVLACLFCLLQPQLDIFIGLAYGYVLHYYFKNTLVSTPFLYKIETACSSCLSSRQDFITLSNVNTTVLPVQ